MEARNEANWNTQNTDETLNISVLKWSIDDCKLTNILSKRDNGNDDMI